MVREHGRGRVRVVVGGQVPPPQSGQHVAVARAVEGLSADGRMDVEHLPYRFAATMTGHGRLAGRKVVALLALVIRVLALARGGRVDVFIHPVSGPGAIAAVKDGVVVAAARLVSRRVVLQFHGGGHAVAWRDPTVLQRSLRRVLGLADLGVVHATMHRRDPLHLGIDRVAVVPHRVPDRRDVTLRSPHRYEDGETRVLYVGHMGPHRGTAELVDAVVRLRCQGVPVRLALVGTPAQGWTPADLDELLAGVPPEAVTHHGELSGEELDRMFAAADLFVFPSRFVAESFGLVLVEALMWGLPVVATDWQAAAEVLADPSLDVVLHPTGPSLTDEVAAALEDMVGQIRRGEVQVPSLSNRAVYEHTYSDDAFPLADVIIDLVRAPGR